MKKCLYCSVYSLERELPNRCRSCHAVSAQVTKCKKVNELTEVIRIGIMTENLVTQTSMNKKKFELKIDEYTRSHCTCT